MDPVASHDARIARLEQELAEVVRRLSVLEGHAPAVAHVPAVADVPPLESVSLPEPGPLPAPPSHDTTAVAAVLGRSCIVLGGAFLLRALTDAAVLPGGAGVAIGLLYALFWLWAAHRDDPARRLSAHAHGVTAVTIGWPLVWEATVRFGVLGQVSSPVVLALLTAAAYIVAARRALPVVAGLAGFGSIAVALAIASAADRFGGAALLLMAIGTATFWLADSQSRAWLRWPLSIAAGLSVMAVTFRALAAPPRETLVMALVTQTLLLATMQGSLAIRFVLLGRRARVFDMAQAASGLAIAVGGALLVTRGSATGWTVIALVTLLLAMGAYLGAFVRLADRPHLASSFHTATTFGLVSLVTALVVLLDGVALVTGTLVLAALAATVSPAHLRSTLVPHGVVLALAALAGSGAGPVVFGAWVGAPSAWPSIPWLVVVTMAAAAVAALWPVPACAPAERTFIRTTQFAAAGACAIVAGSLIVLVAGPWIAGTPPSAGVIASVRTVVVALLAIALGAASRVPRAQRLTALVYPVLALGGLRFVADDLRHSDASTMFIALAAYGAALALAPRLAARHRT